MIYLDSSALVKLVFEERESGALADWLAERDGVPRISSALARVEVLRTCRLIAPVALWAAERVLDGLDLVPVDRQVLAAATVLEPEGLPTLDALHLATAVSIGASVEAFICYDLRLDRAADLAGLPVASPG